MVKSQRTRVCSALADQGRWEDGLCAPDSEHLPGPPPPFPPSRSDTLWLEFSVSILVHAAACHLPLVLFKSGLMKRNVCGIIGSLLGLRLECRECERSRRCTGTSAALRPVSVKYCPSQKNIDSSCLHSVNSEAARSLRQT